MYFFAGDEATKNLLVSSYENVKLCHISTKDLIYNAETIPQKP